jgi:methionine aminopeptidase
MSHTKSEREIGLIRESCRLVVETFKFIEKTISAGMTTMELDYEIDKYIHGFGGRPAFKGYKVNGKIFPASSCISVESPAKSSALTLAWSTTVFLAMRQKLIPSAKSTSCASA